MRFLFSSSRFGFQQQWDRSTHVLQVLGTSWVCRLTSWLLSLWENMLIAYPNWNCVVLNTHVFHVLRQRLYVDIGAYTNGWFYPFSADYVQYAVDLNLDASNGEVRPDKQVNRAHSACSSM
ncbi:hypothetical protein H310_04987 [Aphanomyces invadans]|uniref:Uncharacterized protein n=1 Tax=Aphanomyces invadans TaxID=157072 RepID=A0A024UBB9_9STRA|nr:hypothetical protein H310_04987 [Aphanomyces invadans]ETW03574.1 hypothetical protein H310_04987 [Aphanomyces invadans]|eukprot:XP_008867803.1 hypothetical protein H310_04987 [Aphanomyces invadans]